LRRPGSFGLALLRRLVVLYLTHREFLEPFQILLEPRVRLTLPYTRRVPVPREGVRMLVNRHVQLVLHVDAGQARRLPEANGRFSESYRDLNGRVGTFVWRTCQRANASPRHDRLRPRAATSRGGWETVWKHLVAAARCTTPPRRASCLPSPQCLRRWSGSCRHSARVSSYARVCRAVSPHLYTLHCLD
jgi:hypothetical protein